MSTKLGADFSPYVPVRASRWLHGRREGDLRMPTLVGESRDPLEAQIARAHDEVVREEWAPARYGIAPHIRIGKWWFNVLWLLPIGFVALILASGVAVEVRSLSAVLGFILVFVGPDFGGG